MAFSTVAKLGAGTQLYFENPASPGVYKLLDNALLVGQTGEEGDFTETTPISKTVREYVRSLKTPPTKQFTFNDVPADANYAEFISVWDDEANVDQVNMRLDFTNGRRSDFVVVPNGRVLDEPSGDAQLQMIFFGQQSGSAAWSEF